MKLIKDIKQRPEGITEDFVFVRGELCKCGGVIPRLETRGQENHVGLCQECGRDGHFGVETISIKIPIIAIGNVADPISPSRYPEPSEEFALSIHDLETGEEITEEITLDKAFTSTEPEHPVRRWR